MTLDRLIEMLTNIRNVTRKGDQEVVWSTEDRDAPVVHVIAMDIDLVALSSCKAHHLKQHQCLPEPKVATHG